MNKLKFLTFTALFIVGGFFIINSALATSAGLNNAGTGADVATTGTITWSNPDRITTSTGNTFATVTLASPAISHYLQGTNYGFSIPTGATINGIQVTMLRGSSTSSSIKDNVFSLIKGGVVTGDNKKIAAVWSNSDTIVTYGSPSDLWGTTWTPSDINASNFGAALSVTSNKDVNHTGSVDYMQITVTYTPLGSIKVIKNVVAPNGDTDVEDSTSFNVQLSQNVEEGDEVIGTEEISENHSHTFINLDSGDYVVFESVNENYGDISYRGDCNSDGVIDLSQGEDAVCTIINTQKKGSLVVKKVVTHPNGGTAIAGQFSFMLNDGSSTPFIEDEENSLLGENDVMVDPGSYVVTESTLDGSYAVSYNNCAFSVLSNGQMSSETTCTITNSDIPEGDGAITVVKNVINDNGGIAVPGNFILQITKQVDQCEGECPVTIPLPPMQVSSGQANFLSPGTYTVFEGELPEGYTQTGISCTNGDTTVTGTGSVDISLAEQTGWVCTVTNDDQPAILTIIKHTNNESYNGTFTFSVTGQDNQTITTNAGTGSVSLNLDKGGYNVQEIVSDAWIFNGASCQYEGESAGDIISNGEHIVVDNGDSVTCTFNNTAITGGLTVIKNVVGGEDSPSSWQIHVKDSNGNDVFNSPQSGSTEGNGYTLVVGTYVISESDGPSDFPGSFSGDCDENGNVTVTNNSESPAMCTITNVKAGTLIVKKIVVNDDNGELNADNFSFKVNGSQSTQFNSEGENHISVVPGTYNVTEDDTDGYIASLEGCTNIVIGAGDEKTCTITNDDIKPSSRGGGGSGGAQFTIIASSFGAGDINPLGSLTIGVGNTQTYAMTPSAGFQVANVLVDGVSVGAVTTYTFSDINQNHTISVVFAPAEQVAGASTINTESTGGSTNPNGGTQGGTQGENGGTNGGTEQTGNETPSGEVNGGELQENGQVAGAAAVANAGGMQGLLEWLKGINWPWWIILLIIIALLIWYYISNRDKK